MTDKRMDELLNKTREVMDEPPWDDVREARVLQRVLAAANEPMTDLEDAARRGSSTERGSTADTERGPFRPTMIWSAAGLLAAAAALAFVLTRPAATEAPLLGPAAQAPAAPSNSVEHSEIVFEPGTHALLAAGAQVQTLSQSAKLVRLRQSSGAVNYEVAPGRSRRFLVEAHHVEIEVIGTRFDVEVGDDFVEIHVERGAVQVKDHERVIELHSGEDLRVSRFSAVDEAKPTKPSSAAKAKPDPQVTVTRLLKQADNHRRARNWSAAAQVLRTVVGQHASDPRSLGALFTLGRVYQASGQPAKAAQVFSTVQRRAPGGALAEDALAEEAICLSQAGNASRALSRAQLYLSRYPSGPHVARLEPLTR